MPETRIDISELKGAGSDTVKELAKYMKEKTKAEVNTTTSEIVVKGQDTKTSRTYIRVLIRKFIHQQELRDYFRIIGGKDNTLIVKEIKIEEEEE